MKLNSTQKLILTMYGLVFMYFAILHVPFKSKYDSGTVEYETIFSNNSNLLFGRMILIVAIVSILAGVLILLTKSITITNPISQVLSKKNIALITVVVLIFSGFAGYVYWTNRNAELSSQKVATDSVIVAVDTAKAAIDTTRAATKEEIDSWKQSQQTDCTEDMAVKLFRQYMKFNYPDWPILSEPQTMTLNECSYKIQFSTRNPHFGDVADKEVIVVSLRIVGNSYYVNTLRGILY